MEFDDGNFEATDVVYHKNTVEFVTVANEYCKFVEQLGNIQKKRFIGDSLKLLSLLYLKASMLPKTSPLTQEETEKFVSELDWTRINENALEKLGENEVFVDVFKPSEHESFEPESVSLAECFADVYQDLKDFITLYKIGSPQAINDALWECKQNFEQYWGPRLLAALNLLHAMFYNLEDMDDEGYTGNNPDKNSPNNPNNFINQRFN